MFKETENEKPFPTIANSPPKHKDKHNKLRETIEKLKAKSELAEKYGSSKDKPPTELEKPNKETPKEPKKQLKNKNRSKSKEPDYEDGTSTMDSSKTDLSRTKSALKNTSNLDSLSLATEQTLKDITKWLDDASPKFRECSSTSNSPSHYSNLEDFDADKKKPNEKLAVKQAKDVKKRVFNRDPTKFFKRREVQRTIDRLQPGKSKGNLLSNVQSSNKPDDMFPLGPLAKIKDAKNALIVKTDENAPKLSLGSVLDSFGKHRFVDDQKRDSEPAGEDKAEVKAEEAAKVPKTAEEGASSDVKSAIKTEEIATVKTDNVVE